MKIKLLDIKNKKFITPTTDNVEILSDGTIKVCQTNMKLLMCSEVPDVSNNFLIEGDIIVDKGDNINSKCKIWKGVVVKIRGSLSLTHIDYYENYMKGNPFIVENPIAEFQTFQYISQQCSVIGNVFTNPNILD